MYRVKRSERIIETLCLTNSKGEVIKTIDVSIDIDAIASEFNRRRDAFLTAQRRFTAIHKAGKKVAYTTVYGEYGTALADLFEVIFGKEATADILEYFENNYIEMMIQIFPFINERIVPAIYRAVRYSKEQLKNLRRRK